jgi:hypothetical protein
MLITVSQDGRQADFKKLQEAIDLIAASGDRQAGTQVAELTKGEGDAKENQHCSNGDGPVEGCK